MKKKIVSLALAVCLLAIAAVGTLAYFTDKTETKDNTFTVGKVDIDLTETSEADKDAGILPGVKTDDGFKYDNVVPGSKYAKEPVITVEKGSQNAHVFAVLTISNYAELMDMLKAANANEYKDAPIDTTALNKTFLFGTKNGLDKGTLMGGKMNDDGSLSLLYYFDVMSAEESITLFKGVQIPEYLDESLSVITEPVDLSVTAYAIQEENVANAADAAAALGLTGFAK